MAVLPRYYYNEFPQKIFTFEHFHLFTLDDIEVKKTKYDLKWISYTTLLSGVFERCVTNQIGLAYGWWPQHNAH